MYDNNYIFSLCTAGIIDSSYSDEWKGQRSTALNILRKLGWGKSTVESRLQEESQVIIKILKDSSGQPFDPSKLIGVAVSNIICSLLFGKRYDYENEEFKELLGVIDTLMEIMIDVMYIEEVPIVKHISATHKRNKKEIYKAGKKLTTFYKKKIDEAKKEMEQGVDEEDRTNFLIHYLYEMQDSR